MVSAHVCLAADKQHREDAVLPNGLMQRCNQVLLGNRALGKVLLHQLVFALGHQLHQRLVRGFGSACQGRRNFADLAASIATGSVVKRLHRHQIDNAMESIRPADGQLHRHTQPSPALVQIVNQRAQAARAARLGVVHLVHDHEAGNISLLGKLPHPLGHGFHAVLGIHHHGRCLHRQQRSAGLVVEHVKSGRIDKIDLRALPLGIGNGILHGDSAGYFLFVVGSHRRAVFHTALGWSCFRGMQQSGNQGGLAAVRMPHYSYVADLTSLVRFHSLSPPPAVGRTPSTGPRQRKGA